MPAPLPTCLTPEGSGTSDGSYGGLDIAPDGTIIGDYDGKPARWSDLDTFEWIELGDAGRIAFSITADGDVLVRDDRDRASACPAGCGVPTVTPGGTSDIRLLPLDFVAWELGDDGTLIGTRTTTLPNGDTATDVVRTHLTIGD